MKLETMLISSSSPLEPGAPYPVYATSKSQSKVGSLDRAKLLDSIRSSCRLDSSLALTIVEHLLTDPSTPADTIKSITKLEGDSNSRGSKRKALDDVDGNSPSSASISKKSKTSTPEDKHDVCVQCGQVFSSAENKEYSCTWHNEDLEIDDEKYDWPDHDEDCGGEIDSIDMRLDFPQHFTWGCCWEDGGATEGCRISRHESSGRMREFAKLRFLALKKGGPKRSSPHSPSIDSVSDC